MLCGEGQFLSRKLLLVQFRRYHRIIVVVNEKISLGLVLNDPEFGVDVVLELIIIPVEMVRGNIGQNGHIGPEVIHSVQLKTGDLKNIIIKILLGYLPGKALANITGQSDL